MGIELVYENKYGTVIMTGGGGSVVRLTAIEGFGPLNFEYSAAVFPNSDGQETLSQRALPRTITLGIEIVAENISEVLRNSLRVLMHEGYLFVKDGNISRRIFCNRATVSEVTKVIKGTVARFALQFVCDNPYFEDSKDSETALYRREKKLKSPFSLPSAFGEIVLGGTVKIEGDINVEPIISIYYPENVNESENVRILNETTGKSIKLNYAPQRDETIVIDIKRRTIESSMSGNIIAYLSNDTFLGDFVLIRGNNKISVNVGDLNFGFSIKCLYNNLYSEAVMA